jgi:hypothetical protein
MRLALWLALRIVYSDIEINLGESYMRKQEILDFRGKENSFVIL